MNKIIYFLCLSCLAIAVDLPLLERFDSLEATKGTIKNSAILAENEGVEKGALKAIGNGAANREIYSVSVPVTAGEKYALALNYRTDKMQNYTFRIDVLWQGAKQSPLSYNMIASNWRWMHKVYEFAAPDGATSATVRLRLVGAAATSTLWVDFLRMAHISNGRAAGIHITEFETTFDGWQFDKHLIFDHFMPGPGGSIVNEWKEAKVGEAFFKAVGNEAPMQYALYIDNISVTENCNYIFEAWYKATDEFVHNANGMLIFFYKDSKGAAIGQSRFQIRNTKGEWKEILHSFTVPANCCYLDIGLNLRKMKARDTIQLDHLRLKQGKSNAYLRCDINPDTKILALNSTLSGDLINKKIQESKVLLYKAGEKRPLATLPVKPGKQTTLDIAKYEDGAYQAQLEVNIEDGQTLKSDAVPLQFCNNITWSNELGMQKPEADAPAPWKNLIFKQNKVTTWNSEFTFRDSLQLKSIKQNNGTQLLTAPMELTLNGTSLFAAKKTEWKTGNSLCAGTVDISGDGYHGTVTATVDYSGFLHYSLSITADREMNLQKLELKLKTIQLDFVHRSDDSWTAIGSIDLNARKMWNSSHFYNEIHFGNVDEGLAWYAPKAYPAITDYKQEWCTVKQEGEVLFNLINTPKLLKAGESHQQEFALLPYPFRPAENNWRTLRFRAGDYKNLELIWQTSGHLKYCGSTPEIAKPEETKQLIASRTGKILFYQFPFYIMDNIPEWSYFSSKWKGLPARAYDMRKNGGMAHKADISQKSWQDYYLDKMAKALNEYDWDGVYYDCFGTDIFSKNGEIYHPTFDTKLFQERIYNVQRMKNKNSLTVTHMGGAQANTAAIYSNVMLMGEQYRAKCSKHTYYMEFLTLDEFRYENAVNIGPDRMFLPQFHETEKIESPQLSAHVMGLVLLHNLMIYPNFIKKDVQLQVRYRQYAFGMETSTFHPYWSKKAGDIAISNPAVKASYYKNEKGYFVTVFNPTAQSQNVTIALNGSKWSGTSYDAAIDKESAVNEGSIITLPPYQPAFIRID